MSDAAELLGVSVGAIYEACRRHELDSFRIGRRVLIPVEAIDSLVRPGGDIDRGSPR